MGFWDEISGKAVFDLLEKGMKEIKEEIQVTIQNAIREEIAKMPKAECRYQDPPVHECRYYPPEPG